MQAWVLNDIKTPLERIERSAREPSPGHVVVQLESAALNRRDYWISQGLYPGIQTPIVLGSDGAGTVVSVSETHDESWLGREVVINPGFEWGSDPNVQSNDFHILGLPLDGTFASQVTVPTSQLHAKPTHLDWRHAAALPLAGATAYRALFTQGRLQAGETVLITGIGGGVATLALQFAVAAGAEVWVTSSSPEKIERAASFGAKGGFNYRDEDWSKAMRDRAGTPQLILDGAGGKGYGDLLGLAAPAGRVVNYGATAGAPPKLDLFKVFWKQLRLIGSTMGSPSDFSAMLEFVTRHQVEPIIDQVYPLDAANEALDAMASSPQFGKSVLDINP